MSDESEVTEVTGITTSISSTGFASHITPNTPPLPKVPVKGVYVLEEGDTPGRVSIKLYGRTHRAVELARLNMDLAWETGEVINLPD
jgi:hypothetical protein